LVQKPYNGGNTTGFASPAAIYLEDVIDLSAIPDLRRPSRYPVRVTGGKFAARGIQEQDILVVDSAAEHISGRVCIAMANGDVFLAELIKDRNSWKLRPSEGADIEVIEGVDVWGIVTAIVRQAV
jgi:DNA polymerase V